MGDATVVSLNTLMGVGTHKRSVAGDHLKDHLSELDVIELRVLFEGSEAFF